MQELIERADAPDEPAVGPRENARSDLRQRLEQLADGHPSSDHYRDASLGRGDGSADTSRTHGDHATRPDTIRTDTSSDDRRDEPERAGSGKDVPNLRDHVNRPAVDVIQLPADRERHVLDGDGKGKPGGGHRYGTNKPGKTEFPENWPDERIRQAVVDVSRNPDSVLRERTDRWLLTGQRDGVRVSTVVLADGMIWTAWPHPGGPGVRQNPKNGAA